MLKEIARDIINALITCFLNCQDNDLERSGRAEDRANEQARLSYERKHHGRSERDRRSRSVDYARRYGI